MTITSSGKAWKAHVRRGVEFLDKKFPMVSWGTYPGHDPSEALAADAMIPNWMRPIGILIGTRLADYTWEHRVELGLWYQIWRGRIRSMTRPEKGWLPYFDRNNANPSRSHKNHNHDSWYPSAPGGGPGPDPVVTPPPKPKPTYGDDNFVPDLPWTVYLDKLRPGVKNSTSVWVLQKALGIKPRTGDFTEVETAAIRKWQTEVMKDDPRYCDGVLGKLQAKALFGPIVKVDPSSK